MTSHVQHLLTHVSHELKALETARQRYAKQLAPEFSVFDYIYTDEMMLSKMIADLLNPQGKHAQGTVFLSLFLETLDLPANWAGIDLNNAKVIVQTEKMTLQGRRMDIYIHLQTKEQHYGICIENKPYAADGNEQLKDYATEMERIFEKNWHIVYLSGDDREPSQESISPDTLKLWGIQHKCTLTNFPDLNIWLKQCLSESQNDKVSHFIKAFQNYILKTFAGINDMSEQDSILNMVLNNSSHLQATFELFTLKDKIQDELVKKFQSQIIEAAKSKQWKVIDNITPNRYSGLNIFYSEDKSQDLVFRIEFGYSNYGDLIFGIARRDDKYKNDELFNQIHNILSNTFSTEKVRKSVWWAAYIYPENIKNWQTQIHVWSMIESGELCHKIIHYAEQIHDALKQANLLDQL